MYNYHNNILISSGFGVQPPTTDPGDPDNPLPPSLQWVQQGATLSGSTAANFGLVTAISGDGNIIAVASPYLNQRQGLVQTFRWEGSSWVKRGADLKGSARYIGFGESLSLNYDGTVLAIGAPDANGSRGFVKVYKAITLVGDNSITWMPRGSNILGSLYFDQFGTNTVLSADGDTIISSAPLNLASSTAGVTSEQPKKGYVRVHSWNGSAWVQKGATLFGIKNRDSFGIGLDISADGNIIACSSHTNDTGGTEAGFTRAYSWNGSAWIQRGNTFYGARRQLSGSNISLSNDGLTLAIGSPGPNVPRTNNRPVPISDAVPGSISIYSWSGSTWVQKGQSIPGDENHDRCGLSFSMDGNGDKLVVRLGGRRNNDTYTTPRIKIYSWDSNQWILDTTIGAGSPLPGIDSNLRQILDVSKNSDKFIYGDYVSGKAYVYQNTGTVTTPSAPRSIIGAPGYASVNLSWQTPLSNGGSSILNYVIQYSSNNGPWVTVNKSVSTQTYFNVTNLLIDGTAYIFRVAAVNAQGQGPYSPNSAPVTPTSDSSSCGSPAQPVIPTAKNYSRSTADNANHTNWGLLRIIRNSNDTGWGSP